MAGELGDLWAHISDAERCMYVLNRDPALYTVRGLIAGAQDMVAKAASLELMLTIAKGQVGVEEQLHDEAKAAIQRVRELAERAVANNDQDVDPNAGAAILRALAGPDGD